MSRRKNELVGEFKMAAGNVNRIYIKSLLFALTIIKNNIFCNMQSIPVIVVYVTLFDYENVGLLLHTSEILSMILRLIMNARS